MPTDRRPEYFKGAQLRVGIIGCGYVGLPLGLRFAEAGHRVTGFDTDPAKVEKLNRGQTYIQHIPQNKIQQFVQSKHFGATTDFSRLAEMDAILICVPTPLDQRREPDLSYVEQTAQVDPAAPAARATGGAGIDDLSGHDRGTGAADPGRDRDEVPDRARAGERTDRNGFLPGVFARARRSGQQAVRPGADSESGGRSEPAIGARGGVAVRADRGAGGAGQLDARGGNGQAARKYFPVREHRAGQRTENAAACAWASTSGK